VLGLDTSKYHALSDDTVHSPNFCWPAVIMLQNTEYCGVPMAGADLEHKDGLALGMWTAKTRFTPTYAAMVHSVSIFFCS
jgi:hypothetical protein